jgi:hypothetical protein
LEVETEYRKKNNNEKLPIEILKNCIKQYCNHQKCKKVKILDDSVIQDLDQVIYDASKAPE